MYAGLMNDETSSCQALLMIRVRQFLFRRGTGVLTIASYAEESNHEKLAWIDIAIVLNNDIIVAGLVHRAVARFLADAVKGHPFRLNLSNGDRTSTLYVFENFLSTWR